MRGTFTNKSIGSFLRARFCALVVASIHKYGNAGNPRALVIESHHAANHLPMREEVRYMPVYWTL